MPKRCKTSAEIVTNDKTENSTEIMAKIGIDGLQLRHSLFPPKRLDVKMPLQSIGRYRKSTYNSFSGHI